MSRALDALAGVRPLDPVAKRDAVAHLDSLTKPPGSLGRVEELVIWLAGVTGQAAPAVDRPVVIVAAADHGVARDHEVSAYPPEVTAQMVANFLAGGAAISSLAGLAGAEVVVLDVGVASTIPDVLTDGHARLVSAPVGQGTRDMTNGPAMTPDDVHQAIEAGFETAERELDSGANVIAIGEMGIGNTTAASAVVAAVTRRPPRQVTGRGTGINPATWQRKVETVRLALDVNGHPTEPLDILAAVGGLEIAALVGVIAAGASRGVPLVLDGFITAAAALIASELNHAVVPRLVAGHRSIEPGHRIALEHLALRPLLELDMRLGEGTGAVLALTLIKAAAAVRDGMATFQSAGVSGRTGSAHGVGLGR